MSALDDLKDRIDSAIYTNTEQNITGDGLQTVLDDMVDTMGVSVSQNSQTGHTDITVGSTTIPVASAEEFGILKQEVDKANVVIANSGSAATTIQGNLKIYKEVQYKVVVSGFITSLKVYSGGAWRDVNGLTFPINNNSAIFTSDYEGGVIQCYATAGTSVTISKYSEIWNKVETNSDNINKINRHYYNISEVNNTAYPDISTAAAAITQGAYRYPGMVLIFRTDNTHWHAYLYSSTNTGTTAFTNADNWKELSVTRSNIYDMLKYKSVYNVSFRTNNYSYDFDSAVRAVDSTVRIGGTILLYASTNITWHCYVYNSTSAADADFYNINNWSEIPLKKDLGVRHIQIGEDWDLNEFKSIGVISSAGVIMDAKTHFNDNNVVKVIKVSDLIDVSKFPIKKMYIGFDCQLTDDIYDTSKTNDTGTGGAALCPAFTLEDGVHKYIMGGFKTAAIRNEYQRNQYLPALSSNVAFVGCNENFYGGSLNYDDSSMPLMQLADSFAIRWIGATTNDVQMESTAENLRIYSGETTLYTFSYSTYTTTNALVEAINAVADLDAKIIYNTDCTNIHAFTGIYLLKDVTLYDYQEVSQGTTRYNPYVIVKTTNKNQWHRIEIVKDSDVSNKWYVFVDGIPPRQFSWAWTGSIASSAVLYFGGKSTGSNFAYKTRNIDIRINDLLDVEVKTRRVSSSTSMDGAFLLSDKNKYVLPLVGHGINTPDVPPSGALEWFEKQFELLKRKGYSPINLHQFQDYVNGIDNIPKRCYLVTYDDNRYNIVLDKDIIGMHSRYGIQPSNGVIPEGGDDYTYDGNTYSIKELNDYSTILRYYLFAHTDVCLIQLTASELIAFVKGLADYGRQFHYDNTIFACAYGKTSIVARNQQKLFGLTIQFTDDNVNSNYMPAMNRYSIERLSLGYAIDDFVI